MKKLNIWIINRGEIRPFEDNTRPMRSALLTKQLILAGHSVVFWGSTFSHQKKEFLHNKTTKIRVDENLTINLIHGIGYKKNISISRYLDYRITALKFRKLAKQSEKPDIIVSSIPCHHLAYEATKYAIANNIPIISDLRDLWPDIFITFFKFSFLKKLARILLYREFERSKYSCKNATSLVAVSKSYLELSATRGCRSISTNDKVYYVGAISIEDSINDNINLLTKEKRIIYIGSFGHTYELDLVIQTARSFYENSITNVKFVLIGDGDQDKKLRTKSMGLSNIEFTGWLNLKEVKTQLLQAYIGLMPYQPNAPQCIPNKAFDYFSAGIPIISSLQNKNMKEIIKSYELGFTYEAGNWRSLARYCYWFIEHPDKRVQMSRNASMFFKKYGDIRVIYKHYQKHIELVAKKYKS